MLHACVSRKWSTLVHSFPFPSFLMVGKVISLFLIRHQFRHHHLFFYLFIFFFWDNSNSFFNRRSIPSETRTLLPFPLCQGEFISSSSRGQEKVEWLPIQKSFLSFSYPLGSNQQALRNDAGYERPYSLSLLSAFHIGREGALHRTTVPVILLLWCQIKANRVSLALYLYRQVVWNDGSEDGLVIDHLYRFFYHFLPFSYVWGWHTVWKG